MTQQDLAEQIQLARNTVAMYECGEREPCHDVTQKIAEVLGTTTDYLLGCTFDGSGREPHCETTESIIGKLDGLPEADLKEILAFVEFRRHRNGI